MQRLVVERSDEFELSLLRSVEVDAPPAGATARALVTLGLAASVTAAGTASAAGLQASASAAPLPASTGALAGGSLAIVKSLAVGVLGGVVFVSGAAYLGSEARPRSDGEARAVRTVPGAGQAVPPRTRVPAERARGALPIQRAPGEARVPSKGATPSVGALTPSNADSLAAEVTALDRARADLGRRDALSALRELDRYALDHPAGSLAREASLLRVQALILAGKRVEAERLAQALLLARPDGLYASRLRALLAEAPGH